MKDKQYQVVIIGGGTAGITVASKLKRKKLNLKVAIIDPTDHHYYQPAWTLVGAGTFNMQDTIRPEKDYIPKGVDWIKEYAEDIDPENNLVTIKNGDKYSYDYLVVAPGIKIDLSLLDGLTETMDKNNVCSNYTNPEYTWEVLQKTKKGVALFTQAPTPIKCGGAPQKTAYLSADYFRKNGLAKDVKTVLALPGSVIFGVKEFADTLMQVVYRYGMILKFYHKLTKIDAVNKVAHFTLTATDESNCIITVNDDDNVIHEEIVGEAKVTIPYDMLHLAPPQTAPDLVSKSLLAHKEGVNKGWMKVNQFTMQSPDYFNVFGLGDSAALPTAKTGAAVRKQAPVIVENILRLMDSKDILPESKGYNGYSSCPLVTGYGKMLLAEFGYGNKRMSDPLLSTFVDTTKEQYSMWLLKKYGLPILYWNFMLRGKA